MSPLGGITPARTRALKLLQGAVLWRAYVNANPGFQEKRAHNAWARWIAGFEPALERRGEVTEYCSQLATLAHKLAHEYAAHDPTLD